MANNLLKDATLVVPSRNDDTSCLVETNDDNRNDDADDADDADECNSDSSSTVDLAFATMDMAGVNFDVEPSIHDVDDTIHDSDGVDDDAPSSTDAATAATVTTANGSVEEPPSSSESSQQHDNQHEAHHNNHYHARDDMHWHHHNSMDGNNNSRLDEEEEDDELVSFTTCTPKSVWQQMEHDILFSPLKNEDEDKEDVTLETTPTKDCGVDMVEGGSETTRMWSHMIHTGQYIRLIQQANLPKPILKPTPSRRTNQTTTTTTPSVSASPDTMEDTTATTTKDVGFGSALLHYCTQSTLIDNSTNTNDTNDIETMTIMSLEERLLQLQLVGIAALNLFLQVNYTGPALGNAAQSSLQSNSDPSHPQNNTSNTNTNVDIYYDDIQRPYILENPVIRCGDDHDDIETKNDDDETKQQQELNDRHFHNSVLAELAVDGEWPCQVCQLPYWLLVARTLLNYVANYYKANRSTGPSTTSQEHHPNDHDNNKNVIPPQTTAASAVKYNYNYYFPACRVWSVRAAIGHARLMMGEEPSTTLWKEIKSGFRHILRHYCLPVNTTTTTTTTLSSSSLSSCPKLQNQAAALVLEWGLAQHFMDRPGKGRISFYQALQYSGLQVELTGALGKRTKYQHKATAQLQVKASSRSTRQQRQQQSQTKETPNTEASVDAEQQQGNLPSIAVKHSEDEILLENVKYEEDEIESSEPLSLLDQTILLALCLDVKNTNPHCDVLTGEEMGAYLGRLLQLQQPQTQASTDSSAGDAGAINWMVYATALLERAWLEFESSHSKERSILQLQALNDQHSNRLTLTQSTFSAVQEQSAPAQDRLLHLHQLVYPPRWLMIRDLAERYAKMGIVTSAAELFLEIELWDQVVECYKRAGKAALAKEIVEQRLQVNPTPRMWVALGDLTQDPQYYHKAIEQSRGKFSAAHVSLGKYYFEQGNLPESVVYYRNALTLRPLAPQVWFRLGAISMQLQDWSTALEAFSNVVQQEPEEYDAWANVAAIHMKNKHPDEAYPALRESLKYNRTNWRIWTSQLYTCIDLDKCDEAIQACNVLLDLQQSRSSEVPNLEERCVKAIVGKVLALDRAEDSTKRTLSRLHALLDRLSTTKAVATTADGAWIWESLAYFHEQVGWDEHVLENLLKEYRALQAVPNWERDGHQVTKMVAVVGQISHFYKADKNRDSLVKCRYLVKGVLQKIKAVHSMDQFSTSSTTGGHSSQRMSQEEEIARLEALLVELQELMTASPPSI